MWPTQDDELPHVALGATRHTDHWKSIDAMSLAAQDKSVNKKAVIDHNVANAQCEVARLSPSYDIMP